MGVTVITSLDFVFQAKTHIRALSKREIFSRISPELVQNFKEAVSEVSHQLGCYIESERKDGKPDVSAGLIITSGHRPKSNHNY